jgi:uncharacterized protein involved in high-affinity Fe2+ transport
MKRRGLTIVLVGTLLWVVTPSDVTATTHGKDPTKMTVLIGVQTVGAGTPDEMRVMLELEPAKPMLMPSGAHGGMAMEMVPTPEQKYHFEVKPEDPASKTRISYASVRFAAVNTTTGKKVEADLHPMWGGSGLHYSANGALPGDGVYSATVVVSPPTFARDAVKDRDRWARPVEAESRFRLENGLVTIE